MKSVGFEPTTHPLLVIQHYPLGHLYRESLIGPKILTPVRKKLSYQAASLLPLPSSKNPDDGGTASLPAIPAVCLSRYPHRTPTRYLRFAARLRWSLKKLAPKPLQISTCLPVRFDILRSPALSVLQRLREHGPVPILLNRRCPKKLYRNGFL